MFAYNTWQQISTFFHFSVPSLPSGSDCSIIEHPLCQTHLLKETRTKYTKQKEATRSLFTHIIVKVGFSGRTSCVESCLQSCIFMLFSFSLFSCISPTPLPVGLERADMVLKGGFGNGAVAFG